jgi:hypothetical protein
LKSPILGSSQYGEYYLYPVEVNGEERSFFATPEIHNQISELHLGPGDTVILRKLAQQNGKKVNAKLVLEVVSKVDVKPETTSDQLKDLMIQPMKEASEVVNAVPELGFRAEDARSIGLSIYISRTKQI